MKMPFQRRREETSPAMSVLLSMAGQHLWSGSVSTICFKSEKRGLKRLGFCGVVRYVDVRMWQGVQGKNGDNLGGKPKQKADWLRRHCVSLA